jgi:hypothetical protein
MKKNIKNTAVQSELIGDFSELLGTLVSAFLVCLICMMVYNHFQPQDKLDSASIDRLRQVFIVGTSYFAPEAREHMAYMSLLVLFPPAAYFSILLALKFFNKKRVKTIANAYLVLQILTILIIIFIMRQDSKNVGFFLGFLYFYEHFRSFISLAFLAAIPIFIYYVLVAGYLKKYKGVLDKASLYAVDIASIYLAYLICSMGIFSINTVDFNCIYGHFDAYFYSIAQVYAGRALLVDFANQYGMYPHFLEPIFHFFGLSVLKFTTLMALLLMISFLSIYVFLRGIIKNRLVLFSGFTMFLCLAYSYTKLSGYRTNGVVDQVFQVHPHRILFPMLIILLIFFYFQKRHLWTYYLNFIVASVAVLWNFETGIVVLILWLLVLVYEELLKSEKKPIMRALRHLKIWIFIFLLVFSAYNIYIYARNGSFPDFKKFFEYQQTFFVLGFFMLPMTIMHPWNIAILIYMAGLAHSARCILSNENTVKAKMVFSLSILGFGVFDYFLGRSHDINLTQVWYPAVLLLVICVDGLFCQIQERTFFKRINLLKAFILICICTIILSSNISFFKDLDMVYGIRKAKQEVIGGEVSTEVTKNVKFIKEHTTPGEEVIILSNHAGIYYAESNTRSPLRVPGFSEMFLRSDVDYILNFLKNDSNKGIKVFLDQRFSDTQYKIEIINCLHTNGTMETVYEIPNAVKKGT